MRAMAQSTPWPTSRMCPFSQNHLAVDDDVLDSFTILKRFRVGRAIDDPLGIENRYIRKIAFDQQAAILDTNFRSIQ